jgi:CBS domain containing-hemolysin-like protein
MSRAMPDSEHSSGNPASGIRNLPAVIPSHESPERDGLFTRLARALFGWRSGTTRADLQVVLEAAIPGETGVSAAERKMLRNILALHERRIEDVMVPRADIIAVQQDISLGELIKVFQIAGHSRLVVYNDTLDDPIGLVHIRDLIAFMATRAEVAAKKNVKRKKPLPAGLDLKSVNLAMPLSEAELIREMLFVPPSMPALDLLAKMQAMRIQLALVVDEYGGTDGLVSMEDVVEEIVGEIEDEHDEDDDPTVVRQPDGSFVADARARLENVVTVVGPEFELGDAAQEVDTLGGYLMAQSGRLPLRGELVSGPPGFEIEVLDSDPRRVKRVRIHRRTDRKIERDREGRRRYSGPDVSSSASIAANEDPPAEFAEPDSETQSRASQETPRNPTRS